MKKVIMYKWNAVRSNRWGWSIEEVYDDWNNVYSDPYYVEIPDDFQLKNTIYGDKMYFQDGCDDGYEVSQFSEHENCIPYLIGGSSVEQIKLRVIGPVMENEE